MERILTVHTTTDLESFLQWKTDTCSADAAQEEEWDTEEHHFDTHRVYS